MSMNRVALLPNVYMMFSTFANGGTPSWTAVIAVTAILDLAAVAALAWATSRAGNDSVSDGMVFGLWLIATLLLSPLAWRHELVLLFPVFLFTYVAAMRILSKDHPFARTGLAAGAILICICASVELIHALPDLHPQMLTALLVSFIGTILILRSWIAAEPSMRSALAAPRNATATNQ
jgi:uncharacterized membrane protein